MATMHVSGKLGWPELAKDRKFMKAYKNPATRTKYINSGTARMIKFKPLGGLEKAILGISLMKMTAKARSDFASYLCYASGLGNPTVNRKKFAGPIINLRRVGKRILRHNRIK